MKKILIILLSFFIVFKGLAQPADTLKELIYYHFDRSEFAEVIVYSQKALEGYEAGDDLFDQAGCLNIMGIAYQNQGRYEDAIACYNRCCELMEELKKANPDDFPYYERNIRYTQNNIAMIYMSAGEFDKAEKLLRKCMDMVGEPKDTIGYLDMATYLQNLAQIYLEEAQVMESGTAREEKLDEAVKMSTMSLDYSKRYGDRIAKLTNRMIVLAKSYLLVGRYEEALSLADEAMETAVSEGDLLLQVETQALYCMYYTEQKDYKNAEQQYLKAFEMAKAGEFRNFELQALEGAYAAAKHFDKGKALDYYEQCTALKDSIFNENQQQLIRDYEARYNLTEKEHQLMAQEEKNKQSRRMTVVLSILMAVLLGMLVVLLRLSYVRKNQNKKLTNLNKLKDNLLSVASHDVRTSVIAQNMVLEQMYKHFNSMDESELKSGLLALKTSSDAMKDELNNILQWIVDELGNHESKKVRFNLSKLVQSVVASQMMKIKAKEIDLHTDIDSRLECNDDPNAVSIVLQNLLSNAIKFSQPKGEVNIKAEVREGKVWLSVIDHGVGISQKKLQVLMKDIIEPMQGTAGETGTGIGLMVCKRLIDRNNGKIVIDNTQKGNTIVCFSINK